MVDETTRENPSAAEWTRISHIVEPILAEPLADLIREGYDQKVDHDLLYLSILYYIYDVFKDEDVFDDFDKGAVLMAEVAVKRGARNGGKAAIEKLRARLQAAFSD